jgi:hypothetical protein
MPENDRLERARKIWNQFNGGSAGLYGEGVVERLQEIILGLIDEGILEDTEIIGALQEVQNKSEGFRQVVDEAQNARTSAAANAASRVAGALGVDFPTGADTGGSEQEDPEAGVVADIIARTAQRFTDAEGNVHLTPTLSYFGPGPNGNHVFTDQNGRQKVFGTDGSFMGDFQDVMEASRAGGAGSGGSVRQEFESERALRDAQTQAILAELGLGNRELTEDGRQFDASFGENQFQFDTSLGENQRQFDANFGLDAGRLGLDTARDIGRLNLDTNEQIMDILRNPADFLFRAFSTRGEESPFPQVTQGDLITRLRAEMERALQLGADVSGAQPGPRQQRQLQPAPPVSERSLSAGVNPQTGFFDNPQNASQISFNDALHATGDPLAADQAARDAFVDQFNPSLNGGATPALVHQFLIDENNPISTTPLGALTTQAQSDRNSNRNIPAVSAVPAAVARFQAGNISPAAPTPVGVSRGPVSAAPVSQAARTAERLGFQSLQEAAEVGLFENGGQTTDRRLVVGDSKTGKANEELVLNPTGAPLAIVPLKGVKGRLKGKKKIPHFAEGTLSSQEFIELFNSDPAAANELTGGSANTLSYLQNLINEEQAAPAPTTETTVSGGNAAGGTTTTTGDISTGTSGGSGAYLGGGAVGTPSSPYTPPPPAIPAPSPPAQGGGGPNPNINAQGGFARNPIFGQGRLSQAGVTGVNQGFVGGGTDQAAPQNLGARLPSLQGLFEEIFNRGAVTQDDIRAFEEMSRPPAVRDVLGGGQPSRLKLPFELFSPQQLASLSPGETQALNTSLVNQYDIPLEDAVFNQQERFGRTRQRARGRLRF